MFRKPTRPTKVLSSTPSSSLVVGSILQQALALSFLLPETSPEPTATSKSSSAAGETPPSPEVIHLDDSSSSSSSSTSSSSASSSSSSSTFTKPPISPNLTRPSVIIGSTKQSPSEKLKHLQEIRKACIRPAQQCFYIFKKGAQKGLRCAKSCNLNENLCNFHLKQQSSTSVSAPRPTVKPTNTRINRLWQNKKYFLVKILDVSKVMLKCEGRYFILRLPRGIVNPESPSQKDYLNRNDSGTTVWKTLK